MADTLAVAAPNVLAPASKLMQAVGNVNAVWASVNLAWPFPGKSKSRISACATSPTSKSTSGTMLVRLPKMSPLMSPVVEVLAMGSHFASTWATWDTVALTVGRSKKTPAPALPRFSKTEKPRRSSGVKEVESVRETLSNPAWNGMADIFVSGL